MSSTEFEKPTTLAEAAVLFLGTLSATKRENITPAIMNFVRWYGGGQPIVNLSPPKLAEYGEGQPAGEEGAAKIKTVRELLAFMAKNEWASANFSSHLKAKRSPIKAKPSLSRAPSQESVSLTPDKQLEINVELETLKDRRVHVLDDIKRAAADKDLKENAPYHAAREEKAKLDGKIKELDDILKHAVIAETESCPAGAVAGLGRKVTLKDLSSGITIVYTLVTPREVNPKTGRISPVSPIGKALIGRSAGETFEVNAPARVNRYFIECIE
jgi:transcription elongation factor GreA